MRKLTAILIVLMLACAIVPQAAAMSNSLKVIVTVEKGYFEPGSDIDITVHVFDKGTYVSADTISVQVGSYPFVEVNVTETQTGIYVGTYTVMPEDTTLYISATASRGTDSDTGDTYLDLEEEPEVEPDFTVEITLDDPGDYQAQPGDAVEITVKVKENGTLVAPDLFELEIEGYAQSHTNPDVGTYKSTYNIPSTLNKGGDYEISARAEKDSMEDYDHDSFSVIFFTVCYHEISKTNTTSTFDIYVSDMTGKVVVGAAVSISYDHDDNYQTPEMTRQGTTDSLGKVGFTIHYEDINYVDIDGTVGYGGKSQEFDGTIWISEGTGFEPEEPEDEGFDVIDTDPLKVYGAGDSVSRHYTAYMDADPWMSEEIYYYITEGFIPTYHLIKQGIVTTDATGKFSISFTAPEDMVILIFKTARPKTQDDYFYDQDDDLVYEEDREYVITGAGADLPMLDWDDDVTVSVGTLRVGEPTSISVGGGNVPSGTRVIAAWFVGSAEDYLDLVVSAAFDYKWQCWTGMSGVALSKSGGEYTGEILLPEYMPDNEDYTIIAGWITSDGEAHLNYVVLKPGESGESDGKSDDEDLLENEFFLILVLLIILVVLIAVIKMAGRGKKKTQF